MIAPAIPAPAPKGRFGNGQLRRQVAEWLAARPGPHKVGEIAKDHGRSAGAVSNALTTLAGRGEAARLTATVTYGRQVHPVTCPGAVPVQGQRAPRRRQARGLHHRRQRPGRRTQPVPAGQHAHPGDRGRRPVQRHPARRRAKAHHPPGRLGLPGHLERPSDTANTMTGARVVILAGPAATSQAVARAVTASARTA